MLSVDSRKFKELICLKKLSVLFSVCLIFILSYTLCAKASDYDTIKVGLFYGSTAKSAVTIEVDSGLSYGVFDGTKHVERGVLYGNAFTIASHSATQIIINGAQVEETGGSNLSIVPLSGNIRIEGTLYRGGAVFTNASETALCVMNVLTTEEYLYGVIGGEMPSSWHKEALKAQAICARGFAISNFNKHSSYGFNVCATTNCQVYKGISAETASTISAVDETRGEVLRYNGQIAQTLFYSSSGGYTANSKNVWGSSIPYLSGVPDPYESPDTPRHTWSATLTKEEITEVLIANGIDIGTLVNLRATSDETGRVYELTAYGTNGSHTLTKQQTYSPFYSKGVLSQKYSLTPVASASKPVYAQGSGSAAIINGFAAISASGSVWDVSGGFNIKSSRGTSDYTPGNVTAYTFNGGGWGHGVGMSQYGAKGMAEGGFTYDAILSHYYPGTQLEYIN